MTVDRATRRRWLWGLMAVCALGIAGFAVPPYLTGDPADSALPLNPEVALHYLVLALHAVPGGLAMIIGPFQFSTRLRARYPRVHRAAGRVYLCAVVAASISALFAATFSINGFSVQVAFYLLVAAWLYTATQAYRTIRRGQVALHRVWMIRNYALTFAAVTLRVYLLAGMLLLRPRGVPLDEIYNASVWASILVNAVVAEYFIVRVSASTRVREPAGTGASLSA